MTILRRVLILAAAVTITGCILYIIWLAIFDEPEPDEW